VFFRFTSEERAAFDGDRRTIPVGITPYYASIIDPEDAGHPLRKTVVPLVYEHLGSPGESPDPLDENEMMPVPGLVHRYPDRVLFLVSTVCGAYCRYCTRSRLVGEGGHGQTMSRERWEACIAYIESHSEVRDVLLSGGDPLVLPDEALQWLLIRLRRIPHVEMIRIGSKAPIVMPQRVTPALTNLLRRFHPLWMSVHVTHPDEITVRVLPRPQPTGRCR
jgi:lysine 2,3-aminomutase